jgi:hypothetical protein
MKIGENGDEVFIRQRLHECPLQAYTVKQVICNSILHELKQCIFLFKWIQQHSNGS